MKMGKRRVGFVAVVICLLSASFIFGQGKADLSDLVKGNNAFAFDLYSKLKTTEGNIFFSPYSISAALAMTYAGARGNTEKQMAQVMHFGKDQKGFHEAFGELQKRLNDLQKKGNVKLSVANSLWMQKDYRFLPSFLELTGKNYEAGFNYVDYIKKTENARKEINTWVERKTSDKIKDLIAPGVLSDMTRMVLANAIYFKGSWEAKFDTAMTMEMPFWLSEKESVKARMMNMSEKEFRYGENESIQILEMPYAGKDLSMIVILPKKKNGLREIEKTIDVASIDSFITDMRQEKLVITFPRFKTTKECLLAKVLFAMGIIEAFGGKADFSGMTGTKDLFISEVIHKAFVDVNEEGTEAAAATVVVMDRTCIIQPEKKIYFRADHPFLFFIRDTATGSILFMGRIVNPLI